MIDLSEVIEIIAASGIVEDMSNFDPESSWGDNKLDSLDVMTLFLEIEEIKNIKISEKEADEATSAIKLVAVLNSR